MTESKDVLVKRLLDLVEQLFELLAPNLSLDGLASDITVAQLKVLLALRTVGPSPMSRVAEAAGVVPSTATGIVDNLVGKGLVERIADPADRRRVVCRLSSEGEVLANRLWTWGRAQIERVVVGMSTEQLVTGCEAAERLLSTARQEKS